MLGARGPLLTHPFRIIGRWNELWTVKMGSRCWDVRRKLVNQMWVFFASCRSREIRWKKIREWAECTRAKWNIARRRLEKRHQMWNVISQERIDCERRRWTNSLICCGCVETHQQIEMALFQISIISATVTSRRQIQATHELISHANMIPIDSWTSKTKE